MKRKALIAICCVLISVAIAGCQLAKESADVNVDARVNYEDRLVGVLVTTEHLNLFDVEGYFLENPISFQGSEITIIGSTKNDRDRLYATLVPRTYTKEAGETRVTDVYAFDGIEGISSYVLVIQTANADKENSLVFTAYASDNMSDIDISFGHTNLDGGGNESSTSLDGTIFVTPSNKMHTYYINPVYQGADGMVYAVSGNGFTINNETVSEGVVFFQTLEATTTITENGKTNKESILIKISFSVMLAPEKIVILQMDSDNVLISLAEYKPGELPDVIALETGAAYFIVETHKRDDAGELVVTREIYGRDAKNIVTLFATADGVCAKRWAWIVG